MSKGQNKRLWQGSYPRRAKAVRDAAYASPGTKCWRCGRTLAEHPPHRSGRLSFWQAGHVIDGDPRSPLRAEASYCNQVAGGQRSVAIMRRKREPMSPNG